MDKKEAFIIVLNELRKCNLFCGIYDARNGKEDFMYGVSTVMESIASNIDEETADAFSNLFIANMLLSEEKAGI